MIVGVDPGTTQSAVVVFNGTGVDDHFILPNDDVLGYLATMSRAYERSAVLVLEKVASFGMPVGEEVFDTVFWTGRFAERWGRPCHRITRHAVKLHLCKNARANDTHIRQALLDRFGPGREKALGSKAAPGPLYGFAADQWSALAVALTYYDTTLANEGKQ